MPTEDGLAVALWAVGFLLVLVGILVTIARLAVYRHGGRFRPPWRRGVAPLLVGLGLLSVSLVLFGVRGGVRQLWTVVAAVGAVVLVVVLAHRWRSARRRRR